MSDDERALDVGREIADLLLAWRRDMDAEHVTSAIMHALERYSIKIEGPGETGLSSCLYELQKAIDARIRLI